ncbi:hypothetical protein [Methylocystis parvus]|uniref:hypothetical protein n=1 Tax=Methylocystis parvus TaxID=134 RepID=UPI003C72B076
MKVRLGHSANGSVLVPEQFFIERSGWWFYQPSFFGPPILGFDIEPNTHVARFNLDIGGPRETELTRVISTVRSDGLLKRFDDGVQLYRCRVEGPESLVHQSAGRARPLPDGDFALELFHITNGSAAAGIRKSGEFWSSGWNLQGTRKLANVAYVYLTSLPEVLAEDDLRRIAMASDGVIHFQTTSDRDREKILAMTVYRENTTGRTESLPVVVPAAHIAPPHLLLHRTATEAYYEVVGPEIYRIGLQPGASLPYVGGEAIAVADTLKRFSYIILGHAAEIEGLAAPYDEEETKQVMHLEALKEQTFFDFWRQNANSDQITGRIFEVRRF